MNDYGLLEIAADMERSSDLMEAAAPTSEKRGVMRARAAFLSHLAGVLRGWVPKQTETEDDIL